MQRQLAVWRRLRHPNIVRLVDVFDHWPEEGDTEEEGGSGDADGERAEATQWLWIVLDMPHAGERKGLGLFEFIAAQ